MLTVHGLSFHYPDKPLLSQVEFELARGQLLHIYGNNGVGKSTLLKLLAGLLQPQIGTIHYNHQAIFTNLSDYQQQLCYVGHKSAINPLLTVTENCKFDAHWGRKPFDFFALLQEFSLAPLADDKVGYLSAGQQRRVGLLRLAMTDAPLWLLDEPLAALDQATIALWMRYFTKHLSQGGQIVLTSHQPLSLKQVDYREYYL